MQVVVGGLQVLTQLAPWTQTLHVALGALVWGGTVGARGLGVLRGRSTVAARSPDGDRSWQGGRGPIPSRAERQAGAADSIGDRFARTSR